MNVKRFVELAKRTGLASESRIRASLARLAERHDGKLPSSVDVVAQHLIDDRLLTAWQVSKLLDGKFQGFFLGKYKLLEHLGSGGMSSVYLAEHTVLRQLRAIKVLPRKRVGESSYLERFLLEARATAKLDHPNIVRAYDVDHSGDTYFIVVEYVRGKSMQQIVRDAGPLPAERVARYIAQAARGLQHAHHAELIHRDVKPANLLVAENDQVKVLDLGLALLAGENRSSVTLAHNETVLGTADYLAPEQALSSHDVDHRADIYSLGCTMYYLLLGHPPFRTGTLAQRLAMHQSKPPPPISDERPDCPEALVRICMRMLEKSPGDRYQRADDVADDLQAWIESGRMPDWAAADVPAATATAADTPSHDPVRARHAGQGRDREGELPAWRRWIDRIWPWAPFRDRHDNASPSDTLSATEQGTDKAERRSTKSATASSAPDAVTTLARDARPAVGPASQIDGAGDESGRIELGIEVFGESGSLPELQRRLRRRTTPWGLIALSILASLALLIGLMYLLSTLL